MYTNLEVFLGNFSFGMLFISMIFYWIQTVFTFSPFNNVSSSSPDPVPCLEYPSTSEKTNDKVEINNQKGGYIGGTQGRFLESFTPFGTITMILANISLVFLLILRWIESGHFPLSNLYESLMFLSWSCTLIHLFLENLTGGKETFIFSKLIGSITSPSALLTNAFATFSLPPEMQHSAPLVPALQSNWLMMHVTVMILSYSALILGSLLSISFLIITGGKEAEPLTAYVGSATHIQDKEEGQGHKQSGTSFKIILANNLDHLSYRILGIGFPFLTIGILSGAVWANEAWGSYWSWDPKETWALLTWLVFAIYLHARITKGWQGKKPAIIASFGFITVWVCFLGVNLIGEGLHSYGWFS